MTAPLLYAPVSDLRLVLGSTDAGTGTAAQLTDEQLTLALAAATNRVSVYAGNVYDSSTPQAVPPAILHDLTLDIAAYRATMIYLKNKTMAADHPIVLAYTAAMQMLSDARDGKVRLDPVAPGGVGQETGVVINRIPNIFTGHDSNTRVSPVDQTLQADTPADLWHPGWDLGDFGLGAEE